ncbi:MAG: tetraacyldisaccharide 4'-kinase [Gammaproteobacteria bacterium]|nr:tetraacyldisaccharide 4'-kinase [Gammaproteobacteria bacterium]MDH5694030.1 tetraacyldisaccharide 4'-kinase [Gammaproteobacteria bacterium]
MSVDQYWYDTTKKVPFHLKMLTPVFRMLAGLRRLMYRLRLFRSHKPRVPVIVVGNITVGGSGKTPTVVWLVNLLKQAGYHPGVVSRGYLGEAHIWPQQVRPDSDPLMVGDESVLIARRCQCPMAVGPERVAAIKALLNAHKEVDVIVSDDGMQHYAMGRDIEISVIDGKRRFGNGYCLPAGPLREPITRLFSVDFHIVNGGETRKTPYGTEYGMSLRFGKVYNLKNFSKFQKIDSFKGQKIDAVAGIGNPNRFFSQLKKQGIDVDAHPFPDHHKYTVKDFEFSSGRPLLMTEKDAVKCERLAQDHHWCVTVDAQVPQELGDQVLALLEKKIARRKARWTLSYSTS